MVKKIIAVVILTALLTVAIVQAMEKEEQPDNLPGLKMGVKAPDFELTALTGEKVQLSDYKGKKVMLNFWATWCPPCKAEMPAMEKFYRDMKDEIAVLAVNIDPKNDVKGFAEEKGVTFTILLDDQEEVSKIYQIISIPTTYYIDEAGIVQSKHIGAMTQEQMNQFINE
ncbi:alkyl hydroperoxide reductase [Bacillus canaveralius]|uniref:Alkyl hydroperoxide reductase n=1 Tax=Bacillus canaveralius TaxID=1403243 RepID=A0A2N5GLE6_9BACI|nr:redoxin domain-containing protein [Bacillus canaveralius]PLR82462.1 alkyl hydroperoxide reductase [Bacillus canaveralius]PLR95633.1 alkyl hydroperoxide reductase [Bacillus canaveralius]